jgi:hypothetical protein
MAADESGRYTFNLLPVGSYRFVVEQPAFRRYERSGILLSANENVKVDVHMQVEDIKTVVSVNAAATQIETQVATLKETVDRARVVDLPLNGRDAAQLALLVPGVVDGRRSSGITGQDSFSVNGSRRPEAVKAYGCRIHDATIDVWSWQRAPLMLCPMPSCFRMPKTEPVMPAWVANPMPGSRIWSS